MSTGTPGRPRAKTTAKSQESTSDLLSKYFLPFAAVITSAIFYYTGWVYVAHWYGFFGIDATQINLPIQIILLHGVPGILLLVFSGLVPTIIVSILDYLVFKRGLTTNDWSSILTIALMISLTAIQYFASNQPPETNYPIELRLALIGLYVVVGAMIFQLLAPLFRSSPAASSLTYSGAPMPISIQGLVLIFYFFVSVSTSALLGEWDAARGRRLMVGDWQIPQVVMYSGQTIPSLSQIENNISITVYEYGPLGLLASDDNVYYLVDWKTGEYYPKSPEVYIVPRSDDLKISFLVNSDALSNRASPTMTPTP